MTLSRRLVLGAGAALAATRALAAPGEVVVTIGATDAAPPASDAAAWSAYEARLRERLADAGGGKPDEAGARTAFALTNTARTAAGAPILTWHDELAETARAHAGDLAKRNYVEHLSPEGFDPSHRFWLLGRTTIGSPSENIAYHRAEDPPATPGQLFQQWRRSPGHWGNLVRPSHTHAAFALVRQPGRAWLVGLFAHPLTTLAEPLPFRAQGPEIGRALRSLSSELRPRLAIPQGSRMGQVAGAPPVMQITAIRMEPSGQFDVIGGPIFLAAT